MGKQILKCGKQIVFVAMMACVLLIGKQAEAAETATLRVISTTDIHNQINSENYDLAGKSTSKSLAKLNTMIKTARAEINQGCSITVDVGDSVYGYGAETIMGDANQPNNNLQPIFTALSKVGYDAITLGNHEFDYGYTFIKNQIEQAGLQDVCLVANVKEWTTGKYPWNRTKMITKEVETSEGNVKSIKIGIVGVTHSNLSGYYDYNGILLTESVLKTVRTQSAALKKEGADIVVVMAHCGMGTEKATDASTEAGYAMSQISTVDCVMLGHQHRNYPSDDASTRMFYKLSNTDKETGLTNGKPVVMVADHAAGIGIADMILEFNDGKVSVIDAAAEVRKCNVLITPDPEIENVTETYDALIKGTYNEILASVEPGSSITGYFGLLEDNYAIQLDNEAKIRFGMNFIHSKAGADYKDYHVIAATQYYMDGSEGRDDYIEVGNDFTMKDVLNTQLYEHNNNYAYWVTGAQLKEWMEWSASIFAQKDETISSDTALSELMRQWNASSVISDAWLNNWRYYTIFDGLEYEIDASLPARYNIGGDVINPDSRRITKLTCNGEEVTDTTKFILVDHYISKNQAVVNMLYSQRLTTREFRSVYYMKNYVREQGSFGTLTNQSDHNWSVSFGDVSSHIVRSSSLSELYAALKPWYKRTLKVTDDYAYYLTDLSKGAKEEDIYGPLLVLCPSVTVKTNQDVTIYAQASDASGVKEVRYLEGQCEAGDEKWEEASVMTGSALTVSQNGVYSVCASDNNGNKTVKHIEISNIDNTILQVPTIDKFTNKKTSVTGEAQPGVSVHVTINGKTYNTTASSDGTYSCLVNKQMAGKTISVYVSDRDGRKSDTVKSTVLRRGPNAPTLNSVTNKTVTISGSLNDTSSTVFVYIGSTVYVPKTNGTSIYKGCTKYNKKKSITKASSYLVKNGKYYITVSVPSAKKKITVFSVDSLGRCSLTTQQTTKEAAPNQPKVNSICEVERYVSGKVPSATRVCKVTVKAGGKSYSANSTKTGRFLVKTKGFSSGTVVTVTASDSQNGKKRTSVSAKCVVGAESKYTASSGKSKISVNSVNNYSQVVKGKVTTEGNVYINYNDTCAQLIVNKDGTFSYTLPSPLPGGTTLYVSRHNKTTGDTEEVKKVVVKTIKPKKPTILEKKLSKSARKVTVLAAEKAKVVVKVKGKKITVTKCSYSVKRKCYVYEVKIPKGKGKVLCYVKNSAGTSKPASITKK